MVTSNALSEGLGPRGVGQVITLVGSKFLYTTYVAIKQRDMSHLKIRSRRKSNFRDFMKYSRLLSLPSQHLVREDCTLDNTKAI